MPRKPYLKPIKLESSGQLSDMTTPKGRLKKAYRFSEVASQMLQAEQLDIIYSVNGRKNNLKLKSTQSIYHGLIGALIKEGLDGNIQAIKELLDRTEGKAVQRVESQVDIKVSIADQIRDVWKDRDKLKGGIVHIPSEIVDIGDT